MMMRKVGVRDGVLRVPRAYVVIMRVLSKVADRRNTESRWKRMIRDNVH